MLAEHLAMKEENKMAGKPKVTITIEIEGEAPVVTSVDPKAFGTGSFGFYKSMKVPIGRQRLQCNFQMIAVGSKEWDEAQAEDELGVEFS